MNLNLPYGKSSIQVSLPESVDLEVLEPNDVAAKATESELITGALNKQNGSLTFEDFLKGEGELLVIVNDGTRPTPTAKILEKLGDSLEACDARFIVATGVHRGPTEEEYGFIFGSTYNRFKERILVHDARKDDEMVFIGKSANGTEMLLNRAAVEAEKVLVIGSVEPHYFAGYTGGRKGFLPGVAAYKTIEQNHKHALSPNARSLALEGNPVHEDMIDALKTLDGKSIYTIMTVLDRSHNLYGVTAGDINGAFYDAVELAKEVFVVPADKKADIVITCAKYPMDVDLYQSQKAIDNGKLVLKDGGIMLLVSTCREGVGEEAFLNLLSSSESASEVLENIHREYKLGYHKAGKMAEVFQWAQVWAYTELDANLVKKIFMNPVADIQAAIKEALKMKGADAKIIFMPDGSVTVPQVGQN